MQPIVPLLVAGVATSGCVATQLIVLPAPPITPGPLQVTVSGDAVSDPLPLSGTEAAYSNLRVSLRGAVEAAASDWAARHVAARPHGWDMRVHLVSAQARVQQGQRTVELNAEVSLFTLRGHAYLGQTRGYCHESAAEAEDPAKPAVSCAASLARDIAVWLEHVPP